MKNVSFLSLVIFSIFFSCQEQETCMDGIKNQDEVAVDCGGVCSPCPIEYPQTGIHGTNVLYGEDTLFLTAGDYSFDAKVPVGSSLKVKIDLISGVVWYLSSKTNWESSIYESGSQTFEVVNPGNATLRYNLSGDPDPNTPDEGVYKFSFYENSNAVTRTKIISWN